MLPEAFLDRMRQMLGEEYEEFLKAFEGERYYGLRLNEGKIGADGSSAAEVLAGLGPAQKAIGRLTPVPWAKNGYYYEGGAQPGKHPYHEAGLYYIQEPSAMLPAELLNAEPGDRVLDLCAAPGGKSTQLAARLKGKGLLLCNEIHPTRAKILSENVERMGIRNVCVTNETPERLVQKFAGYFDKILVDAPCSGEGMFRKNETACEEWSQENVRLCAARQDEILDCGARMLRPGGRLVYSTCTFAPEEDEGSVERFLARNTDFRLIPIEAGKVGLSGCEGALAGTLKIFPHRARGEGHFAAVLEREGSVPEVGKSGASGGVCGGLPEKEPGEYLSFCRENLRSFPGDTERGNDGNAAERNGRSGAVNFPGGAERGNDGNAAVGHARQDEDQSMGVDRRNRYRYMRFGDNLYLVPEEMPDLKGLKVLRPGLHLGELKKNRFEPSHALALALSPREAVHVWNLKWDDPTVLSYLCGGTFPADGEKGWYLICVDGFSIGWGKLAGGIMKNHYPRGLRVNR